MIVLVVDDDPVIAGLMAQALERDRHIVLVAHSLAEARAVTRWPDVVVADIRLPNGDGRDLQETYAGVPFLTMSGAHGEIPDLPKPFPMSVLRAAVQQAGQP